MNHKANDGSILTTESYVYAVPQIVMPGESAFVGETSMIEGVSVEEYKETAVNFSFSETDEDPNLMEISNVKGIPEDESYRVTGIVKNISEEQQDYIKIAAGLFDIDGELLGVLNGVVDIGVAAGGEAGFELSYPDLPLDILDKIETMEVKAFGEKW